MKNKLNLISSIFSLLLTLSLGIVSIYAWYCTNKEATVNGVSGLVFDNQYNVVLEKGTYDSENGWKWQSISSLELIDINPDDKFYFRINVSGRGMEQAKIKFDDISSELITDNHLTISGHSLGLLYEDVFTPLYDITNSKVIVDDKVLYECSNDGSISLKDYLIEDVFRFYDLGEEAPAYNGYYLNDNNDKVYKAFKKVNISQFTDGEIYFTKALDVYSEVTDTFDNKTTYYQIVDGVPLKSAEYSVEINGKYHYFSLEFNEIDSLKQIREINCSNCYMFQKLIISHVSIRGE